MTLDYRHWGVPLSRRFRALKLWFTLRTYGIEGLQQYIRNHCQLAKEFEKLVIGDDRFEVVNDVRLGLVCFRLRGNDLLNQDLLALINSTGRMHMIPSKVKGHYAIRFAVCYEKATRAHIGKRLTKNCCRPINHFVLRIRVAGDSAPSDENFGSKQIWEKTDTDAGNPTTARQTRPQVFLHTQCIARCL